MKYLIASISLIALASCSVPVQFGFETNGVKTSYSSKGGLIIDIEPAVFIDQSNK